MGRSTGFHCRKRGGWTENNGWNRRTGNKTVIAGPQSRKLEAASFQGSNFSEFTFNPPPRRKFSESLIHQNWVISGRVWTYCFCLHPEVVFRFTAMTWVVFTTCISFCNGFLLAYPSASIESTVTNIGEYYDGENSRLHKAKPEQPVRERYHQYFLCQRYVIVCAIPLSFVRQWWSLHQPWIPAAWRIKVSHFIYF